MIRERRAGGERMSSWSLPLLRHCSSSKHGRLLNSLGRPSRRHAGHLAHLTAALTAQLMGLCISNALHRHICRSPGPLPSCQLGILKVKPSAPLYTTPLYCWPFALPYPGASSSIRPLLLFCRPPPWHECCRCYRRVRPSCAWPAAFLRRGASGSRLRLPFLSLRLSPFMKARHHRPELLHDNLDFSLPSPINAIMPGNLVFTWTIPSACPKFAWFGASTQARRAQLDLVSVPPDI